ncbi:MAG: ribose 5-phosphate isomerase B [Deltaproteobacteria bacterium]|nr:ribose 5-phosphate isomerase B [Deltaproteobacteria bacterium]
MTTKNLVFASDHAGAPLKEKLKEHVQGRGFVFLDVGVHGCESCDYPIYAKALAREVLAGKGLGVLICGTGLGMSMTANRFPGIRAALCLNEYMARMARQHNDSNVLCLGDRVVGVDLAVSILDVFLGTPFEGGRHARRVALIEPDQTVPTL